jgi:nicotinamide mononucleotide adenylyltransferase
MSGQLGRVESQRRRKRKLHYLEDCPYSRKREFDKHYGKEFWEMYKSGSWKEIAKEIKENEGFNASQNE